MGFLAASQFEPVDDLGVFYGKGLLICRGDNVRRNIVMLNDSAWQDLVGTKEDCFVFISEAIVTHHLNCAVV